MVSMRRNLILTFFLGSLALWANPVCAADADADANKLFVEAVHLVQKADNTYDTKESVRLLRGADQLLKKIETNYPQSAIAVQLSTHQLIGDFDISEFEARIRSLSCARGSYVEDFLSEYGIASGTGPLTEACFLYRMENLLIPPEQPIVQARSDWLAVAVGYNLTGQQERARGIVLPYLALLRKTGGGTVPPDSYVVLAKALALTGADTQAQTVADHITDCSGQLSYIMTTLNVSLYMGKDDIAKAVADQLRNYADNNQCEWQQGLVVQGYVLTNRQDDAKQLYDRLAARRTEDVNQGPPPELAIAASMIDDPQAALTLARGAVDREPTIAPEVVNNLARRGDTQSPHDFVNEIRDPVKRAAALSALIVGASVKGDAKLPDSYMTELQNLRNDAPVSADQALVLGHLARAQKAAFKDDRWRTTFQLALNAAERADEAARPSLVTGLAAILTSIKTGRSLLD
jgi:hypothetical protein